VLTWSALIFQPKARTGASSRSPARCTVELTDLARAGPGEAVVVDADIAEPVESVDATGPACVVKVGPA
jgi:hypothetical protein